MNFAGHPDPSQQLLDTPSSQGFLSQQFVQMRPEYLTFNHKNLTVLGGKKLIE
jgi:hypothetical protein